MHRFVWYDFRENTLELNKFQPNYKLNDVFHLEQNNEYQNFHNSHSIACNIEP